MMARLEQYVHRWRRRLGRSEILVRLLRLRTSDDPPTAHGLVLVQIDGLGEDRLRHALDSGRMPFLRQLIDHEHYRCHTLYSGLPSATPAVQGELFHGVRGAVPAFGFIDPDSGRPARLSDPATARRIEDRLKADDRQPLLAGGSSYGNIFTGGAAEPHFCAAALGWGPVLSRLRPLGTLAMVVAHLPGFLRAAGLMVVEAGLALVDVARGTLAGHRLGDELRFVPMRIAVTVGLRELAVVGASLDAARGLPVIHLNLLGFDEQAHRRGPSSRFALWTLKGIDAAIRRLWVAAHRSQRRAYDVWVYADHGQADTRPFHAATGRSLHDALAQALRNDRATAPSSKEAATSAHGHLLGQRTDIPAHSARTADGFTLIALGRIGILRLGQPEGHGHDGAAQIGGAARLAAATAAVAAGVPAALARDDDGTITAVTPDGRHPLPQHAGAVLGADHPFLHEAAADLVDLARHPGAGDVVLLGWRAGGPSLTFTRENGGHGGPSPQETRAFALLPPAAPVPGNAAAFLRPDDLRRAALAWLERGAVLAPSVPGRLRVMTYNVHSCRGMDGHIQPSRIARVIANQHPDVVCLQEVDVERRRSGGIDQAHAIAKALEMEFHFHASLRVEDEQYGNAILSRLPLRVLRAGPLPSPFGEQRGAIKAEITTPHGPVQVVNTHLGLLPRERRPQAGGLVGAGWLDAPKNVPLLLCGDFNTLPGAVVHRLLCDHLRDAQGMVGGRARATFPGRLPSLRIDHVFVNGAVSVSGIVVPRGALTRMASDHLPLIVDIDLTRPAVG